MPNQLHDIEISEISFVDQGASGDEKHRAKTTFFKRDKTVSEKNETAGILRRIFGKADDVPPGDAPPAGAPAPPEGEARSSDQIISEFREKLPEEMRDQFALILQLKAQETPPTPADPEVAKSQKDDEMLKSLEGNPELAKRFEDLRKAEADNAERIAKLEKAERLAGFRKKAGEMTFIPADHDAVAELLEESSRVLGKDSKETLEKLLRVSEGIVQKAKDGKLFFEEGSSQPVDDDPSVEGQRAAAVAKAKEANPKLTDAQAYVQAVKENPGLARELRAIERGEGS